LPSPSSSSSSVAIASTAKSRDVCYRVTHEQRADEEAEEITQLERVVARAPHRLAAIPAH
jgi:hypothetical protein